MNSFLSKVPTLDLNKFINGNDNKKNEFSQEIGASFN